MLRGLRLIRSPFLVRAVAPRAIGPFTPALRHCTIPAAGSEKPASTEAANAKADAAKADAGTTGVATTSSGYDSGPGKGLVLEDDEENLPPLQFEPGVAGAAQKGVSAIVIAFGAVAFGACAWGISGALFPSATSTQVIFSEALEKVQQDPTIAYTLGTPLKGFGSAGSPGRRNAMDRWEVIEGDGEYTIVRFTVASSQGAALVQVQVPVQRKRGEFRYIICELPQRKLVHVLDNRPAEAEAAAAEAAAAAAYAAAAAQAAVASSSSAGDMPAELSAPPTPAAEAAPAEGTFDAK